MEILPFLAAAGSVASIINTMDGPAAAPASTYAAPEAPAPVADLAPATPDVPKPTVMPTPDDEAAKAVKKKQSMSLSQRRGRQSTILSDPVSTDLLGG